MKKLPLLSLLHTRFPDQDRERLFARIMCGEVLVNGERVREPGRPVPVSAQISFTGGRYVSRGGFKLAHALDIWGIDVDGKVALDAGASTGGFTDVLLSRGASRVHAVDVGYNQLDYSLRTHERVVVHERTNIMDVAKLDPEPDFAVADLSFRSIVTAARHILSLTRENRLVALIKPQFETRDEQLEGFEGVVSDTEDLKRILSKVVGGLYREEVAILGTTPSPVKGRKGNVEFLFLLAGPGEVPVAPSRVMETLSAQIESIGGFGR
jgi:23S rRNA (cytidine1920-2'-O)/16S rRNA (cytidine1409-2'-O)-methyltransferase